jgi:hypothetical protein
MEAGGMSPRMDEVDNVWNKLSRAMQEQLPRVAMLVLKNTAFTYRDVGKGREQDAEASAL